MAAHVLSHGDSPSSPAPRLALALSGGLDSMVLLDALAHWLQKRREAGETSPQPLAIHIHHGLSEQADDWLAVCEREARLRGFAFEARRVSVPRDARQGIEGAARAARYEALASICLAHGVDGLMTAHHANDQAETVLLQMLRGAGLPGVAAMASESALPVVGRRSDRVRSLRLLRPLLDVSRETMHAYAKARSLTWVEDPSNEDRHYLRNALRHDVMPAIASHVPAYRETLARFARHAAQAQTLLDQLAQLDFERARVPNVRGDDERLQRTQLQGLDAARLANLLRYWTARRGLATPPEARLDEWVRQIRDAQAEASIELPHGEAVLRLYRDELQWTAIYEVADPDDVASDVVLRWAGERAWHLPQWKGSIVFTPVGGDEEMPGSIDERVLRASPLVAKARAGGERWREHAQGHSRSLKHWYQSRGVAAWLRSVPVVWQAGVIVFVPRLGVDGAAQREAGGKRWVMEWRDEA
ncbi:tRNA lysidine(34) synthetase TilS [Pandoraea aquatica]|uniref:tRNA(Ile)-lysidine synthase n=2 Tax=Pandoraea aquatica TaxID=2508290 RepID=A0A5E4WLP5_9BURK|nr:tRNA lysidine(34) synthetase TilS [Pandoraea aquatica]